MCACAVCVLYVCMCMLCACVVCVCVYMCECIVVCVYRHDRDIGYIFSTKVRQKKGNLIPFTLGIKKEKSHCAAQRQDIFI